MSSSPPPEEAGFKPAYVPAYPPLPTLPHSSLSPSICVSNADFAPDKERDGLVDGQSWGDSDEQPSQLRRQLKARHSELLASLIPRNFEMLIESAIRDAKSL